MLRTPTMKKQTFEVGNIKVVMTPLNIVPINLDYEVTKDVLIEVYIKGLLRTKQVYKQKYMPQPSLTISGFFSHITK